MPDDKLSITITSTSLRKNNIIKEVSVTGITDIKNIAAKINKDIPLAIVLNGKGIINKKIGTTSLTGNPVSSLFPNTNPADFYYEVFQNKVISVVSIVRKKVADDIIAQLKQEGFTIISFSIGFSPLNKIIPYIKADDSKTIESETFLFHLNGGNEILDFSQKEKNNNESGIQPEYLVADQYLKSAAILPFAASAGLMADDLKISSHLNPAIVEKDREDLKYLKYFRASFIALLAVAFLVLLSSFLVYTHYFNLNREMVENELADIQLQQKAALLQKEVRMKEKFLNQSGWNDGSRISYYADRIAGLTPSDILLTSMNINPAKNNSSGEANAFNYKRDTILLTGSCMDPVVLNQFMNAVKLIPGFKEATVKNYQYRKENEAGSFQMEILTK